MPTDDERRVFRECNQESFWYRSLPIATVSMVLTQGLISRGILTSSSRFGSLPKVAFAGLCGYLTGKVSYMRTCQEKFKRLENSPLGDALRHRRLPGQSPASNTEFSDADNVTASPLIRSAPAAAEPLSNVYPSQYDSGHDSVPFSASLSESSTTGITDHAASEPVPFLEENPKATALTYDELRSRNRETYEMAVTQKTETSTRPSQDGLPGELCKY
ncbi:hypothetical protein FKM82_001488 [Ascaphus truei]